MTPRESGLCTSTPKGAYRSVPRPRFNRWRRLNRRTNLRSAPRARSCIYPTISGRWLFQRTASMKLLAVLRPVRPRKQVFPLPAMIQACVLKTFRFSGIPLLLMPSICGCNTHPVDSIRTVTIPSNRYPFPLTAQLWHPTQPALQIPREVL